MSIGSVDDVTDLQEKALTRSRDIRVHAYCSYSNFPVGACLITEDDELVAGINVETASYGGSICAERVAVTTAVAEGKRSFTDIVVIGPHIIPPCGICLNMLAEFAQFSDHDLNVILSDPKLERIELTRLSLLIPRAFSGRDLG